MELPTVSNALLNVLHSYYFVFQITAVSDYESTVEIVLFAPGETEKSITITIFDDTRRESDEFFSITLEAGVGVYLFPNPSAVVNIINDDGM